MLRHGRNTTVKQRYLGIKLVGINVGHEGGGLAAVGAAVLQFTLLAAGRQQLVNVAAPVGSRRVGPGELVGQVSDLTGSQGQAGSRRNIRPTFATALVGQVLVTMYSGL